ncbi:hypothetical protein L6R50_27765 [Myxococcota bacterium]|nr:hypothetical protein [Myxococcota bacterium]
MRGARSAPPPGLPPRPGAAAAILALAASACTGEDPPATAPDPAAWTPTASGAPWPDEAGEPIPLPASLAGLDWLADVSGYGQDFDVASGDEPRRATSGTYGVGNGTVFGILGLDDPGNTLTNAVGPGYQARDGFFGDASAHLVRGGQEVVPTRQQVQRPRRSAVVRTRMADEASGLHLLTTDFAPEGAPWILRWITVLNAGPSPAEDLSLRLSLAGGAPDAAGTMLTQARGDRSMAVGCPGAPGARAEGESLDVPVGDLSPGEERDFACVHAFAAAGEDPSAQAALAPGAPVADLLDASRGAASAFLDGAAALDVPDPKVEDLYEGMLVTLWTQTTPEGLVSPMHRYTSGWLRDGEGAVLLLLRAGLHQRARAVLDGTYRALAVAGEVANSFPLDRDVSSFAEPQDPDAFWAGARFMDGREAAEAPSYGPLLHGEYVRRTGDAAVLEAGRMAYLANCLSRQEPGPDGLLPFSGDETFRFTLASAVGGGMPEELGWSGNSAILWVAAARRWDALLAAASTLGLPPPAAAADVEAMRPGMDAALEAFRVEEPPAGGWNPGGGGFYSPLALYGDLAPWPIPFEDVSFQAVRLGVTESEGGEAPREVDALVAFGMREDGTVLCPVSSLDGPNFGFTGMVPGYVLDAIAAANHGSGERAFEALDAVATPSGHFEEGHVADATVLEVGHVPDGTGADVSARYRPWEGGVVVASMLRWFLGDEPDAASRVVALSPHLPRGWPSLEARGLRAGDLSYDLRLEQFAEGLVATVTPLPGAEADGGWTLDLVLTSPSGTAFAGAWLDGVGAEAAAVDPGTGATPPTLRLEGLALGSRPLQVVAPYAE